jgi:hypothetical protein
MQFVHQLEAAAFIIVLNIVGTFAILKFVGLIVPLRATEDHMEAGDLAIHGIDPMPGIGGARRATAPASIAKHGAHGKLWSRYRWSAGTPPGTQAQVANTRSAK